jgi:hypothetical protein
VNFRQETPDMRRFLAERSMPVFILLCSFVSLWVAAFSFVFAYIIPALIINFSIHPDSSGWALVGARISGLVGFFLTNFLLILARRRGAAQRVEESRIERRADRACPEDFKKAVPWVYTPLIALGIISLAPSVFGGISLFVYFLRSGQFDPREVSALLGLPFVVAAANWAFLAVYFVTVIKVKRDWPALTSARCAMWSSLVAMSIPNLLLVMGFAATLDPSAPNMGEGLGYWTFGEFFIVPIFAVLGWFFGRSLDWFFDRSTVPSPQSAQKPRY